jgi:peptide/nickel transport system substrate-binding protein
MMKKLCCLWLAVLVLTSCQNTPTTQRTTKFGGRLVISKSAGPKTFNRLLSFDDQTNTITNCLMGTLLRIHRQTQQAEPELATAWQASPDGKILTFTLRRDVKFSDGKPFTADDVLFTFQLVNDPKIASAAADSFGFEDKRVAVEKVDEHTVRFTFPNAHAAAERLFDGVPILPKHQLEAAHREGKFTDAWNLATPPEQIVGLGAFRLKSYEAGQRVTLARNEHYWKKDESGKALPYLDELVFSLDPDRNTQLLKFQNGETDLFSPVNADDVKTLAALETQGKIKLHDLGPSLIREVFWFNLNDGKDAKTGQPFVDPVKRAWFAKQKFRQAISHAIDRDALVNLAFAGKATPQWGFHSPGNKLWFASDVAKYPFDQARAQALLAEAGFKFQADRKTLVDAQNHPVEFTLVTNAGNVLRQKMSAVMQEDLAELGIKMNIAQIETRALLARINESFDYDAAMLAIVSGDVDPNSDANILLSSGSGHWWHPNQKQPATPWEKRIDELMRQQAHTLDAQQRKAQFDEVQKLLAEQQPYLFLAARHLLVAAKTDIGNFKPALLPDFVLWNCEELYRKM